MFVGILCSLVSMAATEKTETSTGSYTSNAKASGTSFSIDGTFVAGGGTQKGSMPGGGVKFRTTRNDNTIVFAVAEGYRITKIDFDGYSNDASKTTFVESIKADGIDIDFPRTQLSQNTGSTQFSTGAISAVENITLNLSGTATQANIYFTVTYVQEQVIVQEVTALAIGGVAISADQLASFKSSKELEVNGSSFNGLPSVVPTLSSGTTKVECNIEGTTAEYSFTINSTDAYKVKLTNFARSYSKEGNVIAFKEGSTEATGANTNTVKMNDITFAMVDAGKTFQYGTGKVSLDGTDYTPLKLSTGSAVNVTFPEGKVATKVIVYGWSASNNGKLYCLQETESADGKKVDVSSDVYLSGNNAYDLYPSVYEYVLDNWTSAYFSAGGSPSQPFVVMDFVLADAPKTTLNSFGLATFSAAQNVQITGAKVYTAVVNEDGTELVCTEVEGGLVPAGNGVVLVGEADAEFVATPVASAPALAAGNVLQATTLADGSLKEWPAGTIEFTFVLFGDTFKRLVPNTAFTPNKAYVLATDIFSISAKGLSIVFDDASAINNVAGSKADVAVKKFFKNGQLLIQTAKGTVNAVGVQVK